MQSFEHQGLFWLPDEPNNLVAGILRFDGESQPRLELIGAFRGPQGLQQPFATPLILGVTGGSNVSLAWCTSIGGGMSFPGYVHEKFIVTVTLFGHHFESEDELRFAAVAVEYDHLLKWSGLSGIRPQSITEGGISVLRVEWTAPSGPVAQVPGATVRFRSGMRSSASTDLTSYTLHQNLAVEVEASEPLPLQELHQRYLYHIQNFLSLGVGGPVRATRVTGILPFAEPGRANPKTVEIFYSARGGKGGKLVEPWRMLFTLPDLDTEFEAALRQWIERAQLLEPVYDLYASIIYEGNMSVQNRFLSVTQALESYHRRTRGGSYLADEVFAGLNVALVAVINDPERELPSGTRTAFEGKLQYFNELSLRRRLKELLEFLAEISEVVISDRNAFVNRVVNTRNFLTHFDERSRSGSADENELPRLADHVQFVLECCLLLELGLARERVLQLVRHHERYNYWRRE